MEFDMKPYDDDECRCYEIVDEIDKQFPGCDWNIDDCCREWDKRVIELEDNNIEFNEGADENYGCTCPTCGRMVCGWCV